MVKANKIVKILKTTLIILVCTICTIKKHMEEVLIYVNVWTMAIKF